MSTEAAPQRQINHKMMRVIVGLIALLLSPVVYFLSGKGSELSSISISYWTDARDVFVGSLIAVGFFLSAYNGAGRGRDCEYYLSKLACIFAIGVALIPTKGFSQADVPSAWVQTIADSIGFESRAIHITCAVLLFVCLIFMMWFFSVRAKAKKKPTRAIIYRSIAVLMVLGIVGFLLLGNHFYAEVWGLSFFGLGWFVAGCYKNDPSVQ